MQATLGRDILENPLGAASRFVSQAVVLHTKHPLVLAATVTGQLLRTPDGTVAEASLLQLNPALGAGWCFAPFNRGAGRRAGGCAVDRRSLLLREIEAHAEQ